MYVPVCAGDDDDGMRADGGDGRRRKKRGPPPPPRPPPPPPRPGAPTPHVRAQLGFGLTALLSRRVHACKADFM
jgi:hypothetical protein